MAKNLTIKQQTELLNLPSWKEPSDLDQVRTRIINLGVNLHQHAYLIGKDLMWARDNMGTTEFGHPTKSPENNWVRKNVWFGLSTAYRFMAFAKKCEERGQLLEYHPNKDSDVVTVITPIPKGKYDIIYADPPWKYGQDQHSKEEQDTVLGTHYPSMETEDICALPINELAAENAVLFLWTTSPKLYEAKQVIDSWGFEYKASMVWDKIKHNVGYYVSVRHEFLLICTKGSRLPDSHKLHDSVVSIERTEHSKKPEVFYEIIEEMYQGKKIELFARQPRKGWESWGNQL
jgi:N6-adenosine-specific RNA methylase IME4